MDSSQNENPAVRFLILALTSAAAGIGLLALVGWLFGLPLLASFGADRMPMAPSTALLFVLYGAALFFANSFPSKRASHLMIIIVGSFGLAIALPLLFLSFSGIHPQIEHLGFSLGWTSDGVRIGHMSPLTSLCLVLTALSMLAVHTSSKPRLWTARVALWLACITVVVSLAILLAYLLGTPVLYSSDLITPALSTSIAFLVLAFGLLIAAGRQLWPHRRMSDAASARESFVLVLVFVLLALGIVTAGYFYYKNYERQYRLGVERELSSIAQLKVDELVQWRNERLGNGEVFHLNEVFSGIVKRYFRDRNDRDAATRIRTWVGQLQKASEYDLVMLADGKLKTRFVVPESKELARLVIDPKTIETLLSGKIAFQDFYRNDEDDRVYLKVLVPILDDGSPKRLIGVLALRIDPEKYLYPLISRWPVPSTTSETLIIRREGSEGLFLNELRFQKNTALNLRVSLSNMRLPAVMAVLGKQGIVEGIDYRGVPVVADVRPIPGSPWFLVARMDMSELYTPLSKRLWEMVALIGVLVLGAATGVVGVWRYQGARFYRQQYEAVNALNASEFRYRRLFEAARDGILILDADSGIVVDVNPFLVEMLGYAREQFLEKKIWELGIFKDIAANKANLLELQQKAYIKYENLPLETSAGKLINVEFVSHVYEVDHHTVIQCNIRDITVRKQAEEALTLAHGRLRRFFDTNIAGIVVANAAGDIIEANDYYLKLVDFTREELEHGKIDWRALTPPEWLSADEQAIRELRERGKCTPYEKEYIRRDGTRVAVLLADAMLPGPGEEIAAVALDITERKRAEEAVRQSEKKFRDVAENALVGVYITNLSGDILFVNEAARRIYEFDSVQEMISIGAVARYKNAKDRNILLESLKKTGRIERYEAEVITKTGKTKTIIISATLRGDLIEGMVLDITERKQAEEALRESEQNFSAMAENAHDGILITFASGFHSYANQRASEITGYSINELRQMNMRQLAHPDEIPKLVDRLHRRISGDKIPNPYQTQIVTKSGVAVQVEISAAQTIWQGQHADVVFVRDITERKRAEQALQYYLERLAVINRLDRVITSSFDINEVYDSFVQEMTRLIAFDRTSVVLLDGSGERWQIVHQWTRGVPALLAGEWRPVAGSYVEWLVSRREPLLERQIGEEGDWPETELLRREGISSRVALPLMIKSQVIGAVSVASCRPAAYSEKDLAILRSLADQMAIAVNNSQLYHQTRIYATEMERLVAARTSELEVANKELEAFSYAVSHDLRAPLRGVDGWSLALSEDYAALLDARAREYIERIRSETQRMGNLIDEMLKLARVTRVQMKRERVNLSALADSIVARLRDAQPARAVEFVNQPGLETTGDPTLLDVVITNLLDNAWKFSATHSEVRVEFGREERDGESVFFVRDNGVGFDMAYAGKLFGAFQRLHKSSQFPGTGIGLATVQRIVHRHGGRVWAEAHEGRGATFYFTLQEGS